MSICADMCCCPCRCLKLTEKGLVFMASHCHRLQELRLYACSSVTDRCLQAFGQLAELQLIDLCGGHCITGRPPSCWLN